MIFNTLYGVDCSPDEWVYDLIQSRKGETQVRKALQLVGTELGRQLIGYENIWVDIFKREVSSCLNYTPDQKIVVDDCRFPNEAQALNELGFTVYSCFTP